MKHPCRVPRKYIAQYAGNYQKYMQVRARLMTSLRCTESAQLACRTSRLHLGPVRADHKLGISIISSMLSLSLLRPTLFASGTSAECWAQHASLDARQGDLLYQGLCPSRRKSSGRTRSCRRSQGRCPSHSCCEMQLFLEGVARTDGSAVLMQPFEKHVLCPAFRYRAATRRSCYSAGELVIVLIV